MRNCEKCRLFCRPCLLIMLAVQSFTMAIILFRDVSKMPYNIWYKSSFLSITPRRLQFSQC